ncbi:MAG: RNA ligase, Rnl2 family [Bacteroidales bacterium]|nr:RNA ligase, Rnl2 family [Bacteroidales bacterium]
MLEFKKYSSIENSFNEEYIKKVKEVIDPKLKFVVQEKVHGSNTSFVTDGKEIKFAKRTALVAEDERFFDYEELFDRYKERVLKLYKAIKKKYPDLKSAVIYGEFFGGYYPHKQVKADHRYMTIQKGVCYCPHHEFYGFDIYVYRAELKHYLTVDETNELFEKGGFFYAKSLFEGTLEECLKYPNKFPSTIYQFFGYPPIDDNICEGVVIRPKEPTYVAYGERILIKNKNERFAEKKSEKRVPKPQKPAVEISKNLVNEIALISLYVTENRLNNVISHIGEVQMPRDLGKLIGMLSKDILDDFLKEHSADYYALEKPEQKLLNKEINQQAQKLVKTIYKLQ